VRDPNEVVELDLPHLAHGHVGVEILPEMRSAADALFFRPFHVEVGVITGAAERPCRPWEHVAQDLLHDFATLRGHKVEECQELLLCLVRLAGRPPVGPSSREHRLGLRKRRIQLWLEKPQHFERAEIERVNFKRIALPVETGGKLE
jgi:hypothetical protein